MVSGSEASVEGVKHPGEGIRLNVLGAGSVSQNEIKLTKKKK